MRWWVNHKSQTFRDCYISKDTGEEDTHPHWDCLLLVKPIDKLKYFFCFVEGLKRNCVLIFQVLKIYNV